MANDDPFIAGAVGGTPLVQLSHVVPAGAAEVWLKLESGNPTGSYKDRLAARRFVREEGLLCTTSTGLNVTAAVQLAIERGPGYTVVTLGCDSGVRYLSGELYS